MRLLTGRVQQSKFMGDITRAGELTVTYECLLPAVPAIPCPPRPGLAKTEQ